MRQDVIFSGANGNAVYSALTPVNTSSPFGQVSANGFQFNDHQKDVYLAAVQARPVLTDAQRAATDAAATALETAIGTSFVRVLIGGKVLCELAAAELLALGGATSLDTLNGVAENGQIGQFQAPAAGEVIEVQVFGNATALSWRVALTFLRRK